MTRDRYRIRLVARNEGIEYLDSVDVYHFNVALIGGEWRVYLPGSKGPDFEIHELDDGEKSRILPRINAYLETIWWFGIFRRRYSVVAVRGKPETWP
jgi:hypothetical protein